jgi:cytidylate kinase
MAIITISRELATLGDETARELAKLLDYRLVDKNTLAERIKSYGIEGSKLMKYDERKPSFFASLSHDRDDYLHYLRTAILAEAEHGSCIFIGRGAGVVFRNMPAHISMFLAAPLEIRTERVKSYFHCDEHRARQIIERSDQDRLGFHRYFFDIEWRDPGNYHISLNTGIFQPAACAEIVMMLKNRIFTPEAEEQNKNRLRELILEQKIKHNIMYEQGIPVHFLEVSAVNSDVTLYGVVNSQALSDAAANAAMKTARETAGTNESPGVAESHVAVHNEIQIVHEYTVMP